MPKQVPAKIKNSRYRAAMAMQQSIAYDLARKKIGRELKLLVDQPHIARSEGDAPDVDGRVILATPAPVGEFIRRTVRGSRGYDLLA
jgi:ribosomal protein S12 methylthiotransferase